MVLEFIGAAHEVTGSCHFLSVNGHNILIDCGMEQGADLYVNQEVPVNASEIEYIFVTHAHIDHSGLLPLMFKKGFRGGIYCTSATMQLCNIMLRDSAHIQESDTEWKNRKAKRSGRDQSEPLYTVEDAALTMQLFRPCAYGERVTVCEGVQIVFRDAGHLLGSAFIEVFAEENGVNRKIVFSGDLGNSGRALIRDPEIPESADYLLIESTYGDRIHEAPATGFAQALAGVLRDTFRKGGNVVIPAFSVGRTQEVLYNIRKIKQEGLLGEFGGCDVYVDSPLSVEATKVFSENVLECFREEDAELIRSGVNPITFDNLITSVTTEDSKAINDIKKPSVIISASGMCEAGRIRHHLKHNLWRPECAVVFVGYQMPGTLGGNLLAGAKEVKLFGETISVRASIINLPGISGHADRDHLTDWVRNMPDKPRQIFVVHGEDQVTDEFARHLTEVTNVPAYAPYSGDTFDLITGNRLAYGVVTRTEKRKAKKGSGLFQALTAAGERLTAIIAKYQHVANKDIQKFTSAINALCDKFDMK